MPAISSDLLERYLHAVKFWLPKAQQEDILAELAEDLHSQIEEREASLGRPIAQDELAAILKKRGAPMRVASGYLPEQRLINPAMLPAYRLVLKIALLWVLLPLFVIVFIGPLFTSAHPERVMLEFWVEAWRTGFMVVGIVTVVFTLLDRVNVKGFDQWDPRKLPRVPAAGDTAVRWNHLAGFIFGMLAAAFWAAFLWHRTEFAFPEGIRAILGPVWKYVYWPVLALTLTSASADLLAFLHPCWATVRSRVRLGCDASLLVVLAIFYEAGNWIRIEASNLSSVELSNVTTWVSLSVQIAVGLTAATIIGDAIMEVRRLQRAANQSHTKAQWA